MTHQSDPQNQPLAEIFNEYNLFAPCAFPPRRGTVSRAVASAQLQKKIPHFRRSIDDSAHSLLTYIDDGDDGVVDDDDDELVDVVKMERLRRAEMQSRRMSVQQYMEFAEARGVSFVKQPKVRLPPISRSWSGHSRKSLLYFSILHLSIYLSIYLSISFSL